MGVCSITVVVLLVAVIVGVILSVYLTPSLEKPPIKDGWWGRGTQKDVSSDEVFPFYVDIDEKVLGDLSERLNKTRFFEGLEDVQFHYGFRPEYMRTVVDYWKSSYNWKKQQEHLNMYNHFKTNIEGVNVHFVHVKPKLKPGQKAKPLLMVHGWPGSFFEFYKIIPMLTEPAGTQGDVFELICPSIPGYGFSEAPHKKGFDQVAAARVFHKLMLRLGHESYYVQGGDWGALVTTLMSIMFESHVKGLHTNFATPPQSAWSMVLQLLGTVVPSAVVKESDRWKLYPMLDKFKFYLEELGYFHLQATKPNTVGHALNNSPVGLAAYILDKFSVWTNYEKGVNSEDGALTDKFELDDLLTNVMIYWVTGSISSSMRFYKEHIQSADCRTYNSFPIMVPSGIASFRHELTHVPENFARLRFKNLVQYTDFEDGGHFAALEEPALLAGDIRSFVKKVESAKLSSN